MGVKYSKPASARSHASFRVLATRTWYSSLSKFTKWVRARLKSFGYGKSEVSVKEKLNRLKGIVLGIQTSDSMRKDRRRVRCPICMHGEVTSLPWVTMFHEKNDLNEEGYC